MRHPFEHSLDTETMRKMLAEQSHTLYLIRTREARQKARAELWKHRCGLALRALANERKAA